jgi:tetratricopeptide (TPR) repeat protein
MRNDAAYMKGQQHFLRGEYEKSILDFNIAVERGVDASKIDLPRGLAHLRHGDFIEAIEDFSRALGREPTNEHLYFLRGMAQFNNGNAGKAIDDLTESIQRHAGSGIVFVARSLAFRALKRDAEAENDLRAALTLADVEVELFISEYCIAPALYNLAMSLFDVEKARWGRELWQIRSDLTN